MLTVKLSRRLYAKKPPKIGLWQRFKNKVSEYLSPEPCPPVKDVPLSSDSCSVNPKWKQPRVVIIGAGMAGLSAAQRLLQCGINNFLILEATDRPGGRIYSKWMGDCMTELGAMWIEGACIPNLIYQLATQEGLIVPPLKRFKVAEKTTFFTADGRAISQNTAETALKTFEDIIYTRAVMADLIGKSKTLGEFIERNLEQELNALPAKYRQDIMQVIGCLYNELTNRIGQDPCQVRPLALSEMQLLPGGRVRIPLGFGSVLAPLLRILPPCTIMYCKPVHYIKWDSTSGTVRAVVVCSDKEEFAADYVLVTVPLGVLKQDLMTMFCPELPKRKAAAINLLGFADVERVFIQYEKPFWAGSASIGLGWAVDDLKKSDPDDWTRGLGELTSVPGSNSLIQGMVSSYPATVLSGTPCDRLIPEVGKVMRKFTGDKTLPDPINVMRSNWIEDPFFNGAYTYLALESNPCQIDDLAEPIPNNDLTGDTKQDPPLLLFAGEATSRLNFATVHGARETGIREAQRIIDLTQIFHGPPACRKPCPPCKTKKKKNK